MLILRSTRGSTNDARVLRRSNLAQRFEAGWRPYPESVLLGDSIYPLKPWLIPPIIRNPGNPQQRRFACAHRGTRRMVENAIGILKEKFPCLNYLRLNTIMACRVFQCCVALLCNLSRDDRDIPGDINHNLDDIDEIEDDQELEVEVEAEEKLQSFYNHFI